MSPDLVRRVQSLTLNSPRRKAKSGTIVFRDENFELFDSRIFRKKQAIHFLCGWINEALPAGPFVIKSYIPNAPESGVPTLTVKFQDVSHRLNKKQKQKRHVGSAKSILKKIAKSHNLGYDLDSIEGFTFTDDFPLIQASMTDAALIQRLATRYGYIWGVDGGTLFFKKPASRQNKRKYDPPVLSYRMNDWSLKSFRPEIKYTSGRKRKKAQQGFRNINLLDGKGLGEFISDKLVSMVVTDKEKKRLFDENPHDSKAALIVEEGVAKGVAKITGSESVGSFYHEAVDSMERLVSWFNDTGYQTTAESQSKVVKAAAKIANPTPEDTEETEEEENEELEQGDESGAAAPDNEDEAKRRALGNAAKSAEIIKGNASPTVASMLYTPNRKVTLVGLGKFLSGEYLITETVQTFGEGATSFSTLLKVSRTRFLPGARTTKFLYDVKPIVSSPTWGGILGPRGASNPNQTPVEDMLLPYSEGGNLISALVDDMEEEI